MTRKKRLGRGLEALLNATKDPVPDPMATPAADVTRDPGETGNEQHSQTTSDIVNLSVYEIENNPFQPRREFSESEIASLSESLKEHDILQPILVRIVDGRHQLISGERRLRAAIRANWQTIPARIRVADDRLVSELAIVENLQRKDLNPIEKALSFRRYIDEHGCTQEELANRLKIDRSTLANWMRLLELPRPIQSALQDGDISAGHARALLPLGEEQAQIEFCERIKRDGLSVRATEQGVSEIIAADDKVGFSASNRKSRVASRQVTALENELKLALGTKVKIKTNASGKGQIVVQFQNNLEFERIRSILSGTPERARVA